MQNQNSKKLFLAGLVMLFLCSSSQALWAQKKVERPKVFPKLIQITNKTPVNQKEQLFRQFFEMSSGDELRLERSQVDELGIQHQRHQQYYQGIPVEGGQYTVHARNNQIYSMSGTYLEIKNVNTQASLSSEAALNRAMQQVGAQKYMWESSQKSLHNDYEKPKGELVIFVDFYEQKQARLAYKLDVYAAEPLYRAYVFIDALNGDFLGEHQRIHTHDDEFADQSASGTSLYNGTVNFTADFTGSNYRLRQSSDGGGIQTFDLNNSTNYGNAVDITSSNNSFTASSVQTGVQAHWSAEQTHKYFSQSHNRNSFNGTGGIIRSYVSYSNNYVNAFWDGQRMTYGDGDGVNYGPLVSLDIVGHEITHGVTEYSANLVYSYQSGALNESFSDIFGEAIENFATGTNDWQMGTDMGIGGSGAIRSMNNPNAYGDPDTFGGTNWYTGSGDNGGVHINSGVQNKWFYILSVGESGTNDIGSSYSVSGIGIDKAAAIAYRNLSVYLSTNSQYSDARAGAIQSAIDLFGAGSPEVIATTNAWYAVGVGGEYGTLSYCASAGGNASYEWIASVNIGSFSNNSGSAGYSDFTSQSISLNPGSSVSVSLSPAFSGTVYNEYWKIWIDYNGDGDFSDAGELAFDAGSLSNTTVNGSMNIPAGLSGTTRMRVSMKWDAAQSECESFSYGEVEDYTVDFGGGSGADTQAPTAPSSLSASNISTTSIGITWNASSDNVGVSAYNVYMNSSLLGTVSGTSANITNLSPNTAYSFYVSASDAAGNESAASNTLNVSTQSEADTQAPSSPSNLSAANIAQNSVDLSWNASTDNIGVSSYSLYQNGSFLSNVSGTSSTVSGLNPGTAYSFYVRANDAAGNQSSNSNTVNITTESVPTGGVTEVLSASFFESGWDGWADGGSDCYRYSGSRSWEGNYSIRIRDNSGTASSMTRGGYNLSTYASVDIEFYFYSYSMENGEDFWVQYNDGSGWQTVASYARGTSFENNSFYSAIVTLNSNDYNLSNNAQFRFRCDASGNQDNIYIDEVTIRGTTPSLGFMASKQSGQEIQYLSSLNEFLSPQESLIDEDIVVYPNPSVELLKLNIVDPIESLRIYGADGKLAISPALLGNSKSVNVRHLKAGVYYIVVQTEEEEIRSKFIKR